MFVFPVQTIRIRFDMLMTDIHLYTLTRRICLRMVHTMTENEALKAGLFEFLDKLNHEGSRFMLSYVLEHKGKVNQNLVNWTQDNHYHIIELGDILGISGSRRKEILVTNYER